MRLEAATYNLNEEKDNSNKGNVTEEDNAEEESMSLGVQIMIIVLGIVFVLPIVVWLTINIIAKLCPNSKIGRRFNEWKATRALTDEQKQLRAFHKQKLTFVNATNVSDDG